MATLALLLGLLLNAALLFGQDSLNVTRLGSMIVDGTGNICDVALSGNYLYSASCEHKTLRIADVSDPQNPTVTGILETDYFIHGVARFDDYAYLADITHKLIIIDVSDPTAPVEVGVDTLTSSTRNIRIFGSHAYVFDDVLTILDLADPLQPVVLGTYDAPEFGWVDFVRDLVVVDDYAYLLGPAWMRVVDISSPTQPEEVGVFRTAYEAYNMAVSGTHVYVNEFSNGIEVIDVTEPSAPALLGTLEMDNDIDSDIRDIAAPGNHVFVSDDDYDLHVLGVSDDILTDHVGWHSTEGLGNDIILADNLAYVCDHYRVEIFDISAALPVRNTDFETPTEFVLTPAFPNPFNNTANIAFDLPREVTGRLVVYDVLGRLTNTMYDGRLAAGSHSMQFNGNGLSSGTYFVRLETPAFTATQKAVLLK